MQREPADNPGGWVLGGRYRVLERIGTGGMADVFRARDEVLARDVAVKVFRTRPLSFDNVSDVERQRLELHALATLNHPNLITLFDGSLADADGPAFLVMELIDGPTLSARIQESALPESQAREVGVQIAEALAYVHAQGMVHRDVKPANILLGADHPDDADSVRARLSDFGIVRLLGSERLTNVDATLGTASYLAPEQARGAEVGPVADVYALGLVLLEALSGVRSFDGPPLQAAMARLARDPEIPPGLAQPWPALLAAMTAGDPAARPTAQQVHRTLRDSPASPWSPPAVMVEPLVEERAGRGRLGWLAAAAVAAVVVGFAGVLLVLLRPDSTQDSGAPATRPNPSRHTSAAPASTRPRGPQVAVHTAPAQPAARTSRSHSSSASRTATPTSTSRAAPSSNAASSTVTTAPATSSSAPARSSSPSASSRSSASSGPSASSAAPSSAPPSSSASTG